MLLALACRVLSVDSYTPHSGAEEEDRMGPSNPFLEAPNNKDPVLDVIMQSVQVYKLTFFKTELSFKL